MTAVILTSIALFLAFATIVVTTVELLRARRGGCVMIRDLIATARRALSRATDHAILLGCLHGRRVYVFTEDLVIVWPPRTDESGEPAAWILSQPGVAPPASPSPDLSDLGEAGEVS
jgi:hypothetical protein